MVAADLTQEIFLKLIKSIYNYRFTGKFTNLLFTIAVNTCNDYYKKPVKIYENLDNLQISDVKPEPIESVIQNEVSLSIRGKINILPDIQKNAIILYYYHDIKIKDIAKIEGVSLPTAKSRLKQGKDKLRKLIDEEDYFER